MIAVRERPHTTLITGGTKGVGRAIAQRFAAPGSRVFVNYHRDVDAAERTVAELRRRGAEAEAIALDVGTPEGCATLLEEVAAHSDRLDLLVHCAVRVLPRPALAVDPHAFHEAVGVNGTALLWLTQAALPLLVEGSSIVYVTSRGARKAVANYAAVGTAKALGEALVRYLAVELAPRGVRVNAVAPSGIDTESARLVHGEEAEERARTAAAANPSGRGVVDDDYTALVAFLASPAAAMIQGQVIAVHGGAGL